MIEVFSVPDRPSISIAMASYQGASFIEAQLESFAQQTLLPDEVVICDDGSSDGTGDVVARFAKDAPFAIRFQPNPERLGYTRNFERALTLCNGSLIFISDQDDVWLPEKLATVVAAFEAHPRARVVVNDQIITDREMVDTGITKLGNLHRMGMTSDGLIEGCCTALRKEWRDLLFPIPDGAGDLVQPTLLSYDRWINEMAILLDVREMVPRPLQLFRRHGGNATTWLLSEPRKIGTLDLVGTRARTVPSGAWAERARLLGFYTHWLQERQDLLAEQGIGIDRAMKRVEHERESLERRIALTRSPLLRRVPQIARMLLEGRYRYFYGWKSALRDVVRAER
ncbi:glycosyltransferase [Sphingomonas parva]|uniref:Glycosyltransferase n=1 Tax=Sphingomonas parva TaxID=2555898 RepID=A0A4Y8ZV46_9SPHN|nr:glycosyltransferase [Sphingomonas parva]TFI59898.1 glycosyltransferase [Sphingomonas parva]